MNNQTFITSFERKITAPIKDVWEAWADAGKWSSWVLMDMTNDFKVGSEYHNGKGEGGRYLKIVHKETIQFSWEIKRYKPGSIVEVNFKSIDNKITECKLIHTNLQTQSDKDDSELGWNWAMDSLKSFLETGKPLSWEEWEKLK